MSDFKSKRVVYHTEDLRKGMDNHIDQTLCRKCKLCMSVCPSNRFMFNEQNDMVFIPGREASCQQCGQCMSICEQKAIQIKGLNYERDFY